ncbi:hypothetical protein GOBAR_AA25275 [Gossypium barbadense]|uniref:Uncharacterized protein n=1 Tax=Gossypium barbadense TaxID=3634 RepID=A0A2P5WWC1_GOSBA|nr:hypothetical protein GOBAR_AA25275 [Gossypium barbadense]
MVPVRFPSFTLAKTSSSLLVMRGCGCASRPGTSAAVTCDAHIHSANHQARRYHLVLVDPFLNASNCQPDEVIGSGSLPSPTLNP